MHGFSMLFAMDNILFKTVVTEIDNSLPILRIPQPSFNKQVIEISKTVYALLV